MLFGLLLGVTGIPLGLDGQRTLVVKQVHLGIRGKGDKTKQAEEDEGREPQSAGKVRK